MTTQFERAGLKPLGTNGYQQPVQFDKKELVTAESSLALVRDGKVEALAMGADASLQRARRPGAQKWKRRWCS